MIRGLREVPVHWQPWVPHVTISTQDAQGRTLSSLPAEKKHHIDICLAQSLPNYRAAGVEPLQPPRKQKQARTLWARSMHIVLFLFFLPVAFGSSFGSSLGSSFRFKLPVAEHTCCRGEYW